MMKAQKRETLGDAVPVACGRCRKGVLILTIRGGTKIGACGCAWTIWEIDGHDDATRWVPLQGQVAARRKPRKR
jgi:hypothetical protein